MSAMNPNRQEPAVLFNLLSKLGLEEFYPNKLTLQSFLDINKSSVYEEAVSSVTDIPLGFLRKLLKTNADCRNYTKLSNNDADDDKDPYVQGDTADDSADDKVNPLDLIVALFLCADSSLQQEMALKMSMCQFSVPLLLPHGNNSQTTLMLWALRDIVKKWRPHDLSESRGFVEDNIVQAEMPLFSFVRLKNCSMSKSQVLNHVLSRGQQTHNMFVHREMQGGPHARKIANGLVEIRWYLPSGNKNLDIFPTPVAFANLRGDICDSLTQFSFLYQVSTATFVFLDKVEENEKKILTSLQDMKSKLFLVVNNKDAEEIMSVRKTLKELDLPNSNVKVKHASINVLKFSKKLCDAIKPALSVKTAISIENMFNKAVELGLSVDESKTDKQKKAAEEIINSIGEQSTLDYKKQQLPLQGENWKKLSQLEKEQCRMKEAGVSGLEEYKSGLQKRKEEIREEQSKLQLSKDMKSFLGILSTSNKEERDLFLKWLKFRLNTHSRDTLSEIHDRFAEQCKKEDAKLIAELSQALVDSSLGTEHYMREMGLIYEFSLQSEERANNLYYLPGLAADMLLDGYPLELLDGDASNIPERWVTDVLMELHKKVGERSKLLVLSVLGVQSSGKSTLLNTMFGVQLPVSSGRCTRGAYMLFIRVAPDMQRELNCDFIVLIDTEGLKSVHLAQLQDSYEHDNQLATFVIGLSDIAIINLSMENSTEMKDVLQIATHAFLRRKPIGKKPVCHFVHQNVGGISAHTKTLTERKHLLDQLNEMTKIAAEMEKQPSIKAFTDILDYDIEKNNWNIPGLWNGTPPMAPVNTGYSEAVTDFKKHLLETMKRDSGKGLVQIPEFLEWMKSLWKAVKYENFIFSFRNTLVAHACNNLCKEFSEWEWEFRKEIFSWQEEEKLEILNADNKSELQHLNKLAESKKQQALVKIIAQQNMMTEKLQRYYDREDKDVHLIEKYKTDFLNSIVCLKKEIEHSANNEMDCALELKKSFEEVQVIQRQSRKMIEEQVMKLLSDCKDRKPSDKELEEEFEKMWAQVTANVTGLKEQNIPERILNQLRKNFLNHNVNEEIQNIGDLNETGRGSFEVIQEHIKDDVVKKENFWKRWWAKTPSQTEKLTSFANSVIESCKRFVLDTANKDTDYHDSFTRELLEKIDKSLQKCSNHYQPKFEIDLKLHICGIASREFLKMHRKFLTDRDPKILLKKYKDQYLSDFLDLYNKRDDCQRKATAFATNCIKPAIAEYISRSLGIDIVDDVLKFYSAEYSSRSFFQYSIQKELLQQEDFEGFVRYMNSYEIFVKDWIFQHIQKKMSEDKTLCKLKTEKLKVIDKKITEATDRALKGEDGVQLLDDRGSITVLINYMRKYLIKDISISEEAEKTALFQIQSTCHPFAKSLIESLGELNKQLQREFSDSEDITETLNKLPIKPQDELFNRVFGCGHQCPFCKVPCEARGKEHSQHHAAVHRPQGLGRCRNKDTKTLVETLCTTSVHSEEKFRNTDTKGEWHPYKDYTKYYPDWHIPPDRTIEASDYWKYVLVKYNDRLAEKYKGKPADVPEAWKSITQEQALKGLKAAFNMLE